MTKQRQPRLPLTAQFRLVVLWEDEIRTAAKSLEALREKGLSAKEWQKRAGDALNACGAALYGAEDDGVSLVVSRAPDFRDGRS